MYLYREPNFQGFVWRTNAELADMSKLNPSAKDAVSSVRVGAGIEAILYDKPNFQGKVFTASKDTPQLPNDHNNHTESVKIFKKP